MRVLLKWFVLAVCVVLPASSFADKTSCKELGEDTKSHVICSLVDEDSYLKGVVHFCFDEPVFPLMSFEGGETNALTIFKPNLDPDFLLGIDEADYDLEFDFERFGFEPGMFRSFSNEFWVGEGEERRPLRVFLSLDSWGPDRIQLIGRYHNLNGQCRAVALDYAF